MLNERQKQILEKEGFPTDYEALPLSKKIAIEAIEDMLGYLEGQYPGEPFEFMGYIEQSPLENEQLLAASRYGSVTVRRDISGESPVYEDDFTLVRASDAYAAAINDYLAERFNEADYIVSVTVSRYDGAWDGEATVLRRSNAGVTVFVREKAGEETFENIASTLAGFFRGNVTEHAVSADVFLVKESVFGADLPERFVQDYRAGDYLRQMRYYNWQNGDEKLYEPGR